MFLDINEYNNLFLRNKVCRSVVIKNSYYKCDIPLETEHMVVKL